MEIEKEVTEKVRGRDALLSRLKKSLGEEYSPADDETFLDDIHSHYDALDGELEGYRSSLDKLRGAIQRDPRTGAVFSGLADEESPKSLAYLLGKYFDKESFDGDEEYEKGQAERFRLAQEASERAAKSRGDYDASLERFSTDRSLTPEQRAALDEDVIKMLSGIVDGVIPADIVELVYKGRNYDKDVEEAAKVGAAEGRNAKIRDRLVNSPGEQLPDLNSRSNGAGVAVPSKGSRSARKSFYDDMQEVKE